MTNTKQLERRREQRLEQIPFGKPFIAGKELYYIAQAVLNLHLSGDGEFTQKCHEWFIENLNCKSALLTHSCTAALEMASILCDLEEGDEVIMPSYTFVSTANAFVVRGATPVFVDVREDTLNIDERLIEQAITSRTKAIVVVHYAGVACEMDTIMALANKHDLFVVEDAAHALLATYKGRALGTIGHFGCFSFHETKNVISGEGGAILVNDEKFIDRAEIIREKGTNRKQFFKGEVEKYTWVDIGSSYLPSELIGAFLYAQLEHAQKTNQFRQNVNDRYFSGLKQLEVEGKLRLPHDPKDCENSGHMFYLITASFEERTALNNFLTKKNITAVFHYVPLHSSPAGLKYGRTSGAMNVTDSISERLLRMPLYYGMLDEDVQRVIDSVCSFYESGSESIN